MTIQGPVRICGTGKDRRWFVGGRLYRWQACERECAEDSGRHQTLSKFQI